LSGACTDSPPPPQTAYCLQDLAIPLGRSHPTLEEVQFRLMQEQGWTQEVNAFQLPGLHKHGGMNSFSFERNITEHLKSELGLALQSLGSPCKPSNSHANSLGFIFLK